MRYRIKMMLNGSRLYVGGSADAPYLVLSDKTAGLYDAFTVGKATQNLCNTMADGVISLVFEKMEG